MQAWPIRSLITLGAILALAAPLVGCGSSSKSGTSATTASTGTTGSSATSQLNKQQYVTEANAICAQLASKIAAISQIPNIEVAARKSVPVREKADAELRVLPRPSAEAAIIREWLHLRELATGDIKKAALAKPNSAERTNAGRAEVPVAEKARTLAKFLGLTGCLG